MNKNRHEVFYRKSLSHVSYIISSLFKSHIGIGPNSTQNNQSRTRTFLNLLFLQICTGMGMGLTPFSGISNSMTSWPTTSFAITSNSSFWVLQNGLKKEYMAQNLGNRIIIKILLNEILLWVSRWNKFLSGNDAIPDFFLSVNWYQIRKFLVS